MRLQATFERSPACVSVGKSSLEVTAKHCHGSANQSCDQFDDSDLSFGQQVQEPPIWYSFAKAPSGDIVAGVGDDVDEQL